MYIDVVPAYQVFNCFSYIVRKWNSKELNVGVLEEKFELPEYPKVVEA